jgi:hypothetical protein
MNLLTQNKVTKHASRISGLRVVNFGIPALKTEEGKTTCPYAGSCAKYCYATKGAYLWSNVKPAYRKRYEATLREDFEALISAEIRKAKVDVLRIHDAGDFYNSTYLQKWIRICEMNPSVRFYTYTKSVPLWKRQKVPNNLSVCYSLGGTHDHLVDLDRDRHCRIFDTEIEAVEAGYALAIRNDLIAAKWWNPTNKVGLVWNGRGIR